MHNQEETAIRVTPDVFIPTVTWAIQRDLSRVAWINGVANFNPALGAGWGTDGKGAQGVDVDVLQAAGKTQLFTADPPGAENGPANNTDTYTYKSKFREWVEVKIGSKWYVCSPYNYWRSIEHVKSNAGATAWIAVPGATNEIVTGTITGFANTWAEP